jgi:hypothetical protein
MISNELKIKLAGIACINMPIILGQNYDLTIKNVECREVKEIPNDDGTSNIIYKLMISELSEINIITGRDIIKAKKKGSQSQILRLAIQDKWEQEGQDGDFDDFYVKQMNNVISWYKDTEI